MAALRGTNLTTADATLLSFWLSIPQWARVIAVFASFGGIVWTARGLFSETVTLPDRMHAIEDTVRVMRRDDMEQRERFEHGMMYVMCLIANPGQHACDYIVQRYPEFKMATRAPQQVP